jgi:hypothetical protein
MAERHAGDHATVWCRCLAVPEPWNSQQRVRPCHAVFSATVEANGRRVDPMQSGVTQAFFVTDTKAEKEAALERRL